MRWGVHRRLRGPSPRVARTLDVSTTLLAGALVLGLSGCRGGCRAGSEPETPSTAAPWDHLPRVDAVAHPLGRHLRGRIIGLDPGHGGDRDPLKQIEARANLGVALALRKFLEHDGARVVLTRTRDVEVPLTQRAPRLEQAGAEVLVSIHHNAAASPDANYTSTWYHGDGDRTPASLDLAWPIQRRVMELLSTPATVPTPVLSDHLQFPRAGFQVLRNSRIPAVLCEGSFYTHPPEAERLADPDYLEREAYAYYLGLVEYFTGGTPRMRWVGAAPSLAGTLRITVELDDGLGGRGGWGDDRLRVLASTIAVTVEEERVPHTFDRATARVSFEVGLPGPALPLSLGVVAGPGPLADPAPAQSAKTGPATGIDSAAGTARGASAQRGGPGAVLTAAPGAPVRVDLRFQNIFKHHNHPTRFLLHPGPPAQLAPE